MAIIEKVDNRGIKGVLVDGYLPEFSHYQNMDWDYALKEKLPASDQYRQKFKKRVKQNYRLKPGKNFPTVRSQSNFHKRLKGSLQKKFCQYYGEPCFQLLIPEEGVIPMKRILSFNRIEVLREIYQGFTKEIEKAQSEGKKYYFSLAYLDLNKGNKCDVNEECLSNWSQFMGFEIKGKDDYADFDAYQSAAEIFIPTGFDFAHQEFLERRASKSKNYIENLFEIF